MCRIVVAIPRSYEAEIDTASYGCTGVVTHKNAPHIAGNGQCGALFQSTLGVLRHHALRGGMTGLAGDAGPVFVCEDFSREGDDSYKNILVQRV